jgi:hypothetical protein
MQQATLVAVTLVPLWIVLWRRARAGRWTMMDAADRNLAWTPPAAPERAVQPPAVPQHTIGTRAAAAWLALGTAGLIVCAFDAARTAGTAQRAGRPA